MFASNPRKEKKRYLRKGICSLQWKNSIWMSMKYCTRTHLHDEKNINISVNSHASPFARPLIWWERSCAWSNPLQSGEGVHGIAHGQRDNLLHLLSGQGFAYPLQWFRRLQKVTSCTASTAAAKSIHLSNTLLMVDNAYSFQGVRPNGNPIMISTTRVIRNRAYKSICFHSTSSSRKRKRDERQNYPMRFVCIYPLISSKSYSHCIHFIKPHDVGAQHKVSQRK